LVPSAAATAPLAAARGPVFDVATVKSLLLDPRLAQAKIALDAGRTQEAARSVQALRKALTGDPLERASFAYLEGVLCRRAGMPEAALAAMKLAAEGSGPLAPHATLRIVELSASLGRHAEAVAASKKITIDQRTSINLAALDVALIESLARVGSADDVRPVATRLFFDDSKRPPGWSRLALLVARSLSNKPGLEAARLALEVLDRVRFESAKGRGADEADKLAAQIISRLPREEQAQAKDPAAAGRLARAEKLVISAQAKRALKLLDDLEKKDLAKLSKEELCRLARARGDALTAVKRKREGYDAHVLATDRCAGLELMPRALFDAGRAAQKANLNTEAAALFGRLEAGFPKHERADDARVEGALASLESGNVAAFAKLLSTVTKDYPKGDRTRDGVFALAKNAMQTNAWAEAKEALLLGEALGPAGLGPEQSYYRAGRFAYYLGRAEVGLGNAEAGAKQYESVLLSAPLSYYAALAASRLEASRAGRAERLLSSAISLDNAPNKAPELDLEQAKDPRVVAVIALASVGDAAGLGVALGALGVGDHRADPAMLLFGARMLAIAGDLQGAHAVLRTAREREASDKRREVTELVTELPRGNMRGVYELAFPRLFRAEFEAASKESGVPEGVLFALSREESAFEPKALSHANARGLMQVIPATGSVGARKLGIKYAADTLFDPSANTRIGARFLANLRTQFAAAPPLAFAGYNAGPGAPKRWLEERPGWDFDLWVENIPYTETRNYVKRVLSSVFVYQALYGESVLGEIANCPLAVPP